MGSLENPRVLEAAEKNVGFAGTTKGPDSSVVKLVSPSVERPGKKKE